LTKAAIVLALAYSVIHVVASGIIQPLRTPAIGQVIEELQPLHRLFTTGAATVDHPRQYGPVFLALFHPVYRFTQTRPDLLAWYAYSLGLVAIVAAFLATRRGIRRWLEMQGLPLPAGLTLALLFLWANFSPLYGVLAVKNVELWELALMAVAGAALLEQRRWTAAWAIAAAALTKMLPLVFVPYLLLRDRRTFVFTLVALGGILAAAQLVYGDHMGFGYAPMIANAALSGEGYGNSGGIWHENVSIRGLAYKAFGYLEQPGRGAAYQLGYYVVVPPELRPWARLIGLAAEAAAIAWLVWRFVRHRSMKPFDRLYWEWALVAIMMLALAPQISQDYMVLSLGAFSYVLAGCMVRANRRLWIEFAIAVLLVGNVLPRAVFARLIGIDAIMQFTGYQHLVRAEAYQYFGFPLVGLLLLVHVWIGVSGARAGGQTLR
jgi:hypothetical protein